MKKTLIRVFTLLITTALLIAAVPVAAFAEELQDAQKTNAETVNDPGYIQIDDGYLQVQVSTSNGGFYIGTIEGDKMLKSDNNKNLLYPDEGFDTSFTSFRVTRDGKKSDYVFGRDYSYLGLECEKVAVYKSADNAITSEWVVDGLHFKQIIALMGQDTYQHGMAYISYSVENLSGSAVEDVEARVMLDTALGYQDYAYYMLGQTDGSYVSVDKEKTINGTGYSNYFFAYDSETAPTVTAYMLNASVAGETIVPEKVTFAHWNNLASTVFDYQPSTDNPHDYKDQYNLEYMTADSAVALYYSMGDAADGAQGRGIGFYYGVYSNYDVSDSSVAMNFTSSGNMYLTEDGLNYKDINGKLPGNFSSTIKLQNVGEKTLDEIKIAIYPGEELLPFDERGRLVTDATLQQPYYREIRDLRANESRDIRLDFKIDPTYVTDYRKIKLVVYDTTATDELTEDNTILTKEIYVFCPGSDNAEISFTGMTPNTIFQSGRRFVYMTGDNFNLIRDKSQYRLVLRPLDGGDDVILDQDMVVINPEKNTATLVLDQELRLGTWQLIIDWNDAEVEDIVSDALRITVTDVPQPGDPGFVSSGVYGIVAIIRSGSGTGSDPYHYSLAQYESESKLASSGIEAKDIMLVLRGDFNVLSTEERGNIKAEALTLMEGDVITISDALEVKEGRVTVTVEYDDDGNQKAINVDIDGKVRTANSKTKVWDGVCAITSFNEGQLYTLPVYNEEGVIKYQDGELGGKEITLLWPSAAGGMQTLVGLMFDFRYGEFALMEQNGKLERVIAFGAKLSPEILVPNGAVGNYGISKQEQAHMNMANTNYTSMDLRITQMYNEAEERKWREKQVGTLNIYVDDILFGGEGFIGFNTQVEVGIPSYAQGMPYIQGTLALKIINDYWEFGVEGEADAIVFEMEASLQLKSYNGIPVPDKVYFFVGGFDPGVLVDPIGCLWIKGAGAGVDRIYETFFRSNVVPPLTLLISGQFAIFSILEARADLSLSFRGIEGYLNNIKFGTVTILDTIGGKLYWYPSFEIAFAVRLNILDAIIGEGSIAMRVDYDGNVFFQAYAKATIRIPRKIFLIGGLEIGSASIGLDTKKVWGSVKVIGIGVGVIYYWGGKVSITTGKKVKVPEPEFGFNTDLDTQIYVDEETGEILYLGVANGIRCLASSDGSIEETVITSSPDMMTHSFTLDKDSNEDALLALTFPAKSLMEAEDLKHSFKVTVGGEERELEWYNSDYAADSPVNLGTNALLNYDEETGLASVSLSFTEAESFGKEIVVSTPVACERELYAIERLVDFEGIEFTDNEGYHNDSVVIKGKQVDQLSALAVNAIDEEGNSFLLGEADVTTVSEDSLKVNIKYPENLPTGKYTLRAVGTVVKDGVEAACPMIETTFEYVNLLQPEAPKSAAAAIGGNYTIEVEAEASRADHDGYLVNVYEVTENGLVSTVFTDIPYELTEEEKDAGLLEKMLLTGGRYSSTNEETGEVTYTGLEAGKKYVVKVQSFKIMNDESYLLSEAVYTDEIEMVTPIVTEPKLSIDGAVALAVGSTTVTVDTVNRSSFTVNVDDVGEILSGTYSLNSGEEITWDGGDISFENLADGTYTLSISGVNATKDSFKALYQFTVDTSAPSMQISSPQGGGFFGADTVTVTGITEAGAKITASSVGNEEVTAYADENGTFSVEVPLNRGLAYQDLRVYAEDAVGNRSMAFGCTLTNDILGAPDLKAVIMIDGKEVSEIASSPQEKQLSIAFKSGEDYVILNPDSFAAARVLWKTSVITKTATVSDSGVLTGAEGATGLVTATLDNFTAVARLTPIDLSVLDISLEAPEGGIVYTGEAIEPELIFDTYETLREGVDYTATFTDNVNAGTASVIIQSVEGGKTTGIRLLNFVIEQRAITDAEIIIDKSGVQRPMVTVRLGGKELTEGVDYEVEYVLNAKKNKGIVNITGIGNFKNVVSESYEIDTSPIGMVKNLFNEFEHIFLAGGTGAIMLGGGLGLLGLLILIAIAVVVIIIIKKKKNKKNGTEDKAIESENSSVAPEEQKETVAESAIETEASVEKAAEGEITEETETGEVAETSDETVQENKENEEGSTDV